MLWNRWISSAPASAWRFPITLLTDRAFPCAELLRWFDGKTRWQAHQVLPAGSIMGLPSEALCLKTDRCLPNSHGKSDFMSWSDGAGSCSTWRLQTSLTNYRYCISKKVSNNREVF
jgi:hypothetical protein